MLKDCALTYVQLYVPTLYSTALEDEAILLLRMRVDYSHDVATGWTVAALWEHTLRDHPTDSSTEVLSDPEYVQVALETLFHDISLDGFVFC
jgi:hypothetical protein